MGDKHLKLWNEAVKLAKQKRNSGVRRFQILKGSLLKDAQKIYCALLFMDG